MYRKSAGKHRLNAIQQPITSYKFEILWRVPNSLMAFLTLLNQSQHDETDSGIECALTIRKCIAL